MNYKVFIKRYITLQYESVGDCLLNFQGDNLIIDEYCEDNIYFTGFHCDKCGRSFERSDVNLATLIEHIKEYHPDE